MVNRRYRQGYVFEHYHVAPFFRSIGYYVQESRGSKGLFDLICIPNNTPDMNYKYPEKPLMIQAKDSKYVAPSVFEHIKKEHKWNGIPLIVNNLAEPHRKAQLLIRNMDGVKMDFV